MTDQPKQIPDLQTASTVSAADYIHIRQGIYDKKCQVAQLTSSVTNDCLKKDQNLNDVQSKAQARTNLGLGTAALKNAGDQPNQCLVIRPDGKLPAVDGSLLTNLPVGLSPAAAGNGLSFASGAFHVNVDSNTLEIVNDTLKVKGMTGSSLAGAGLAQDASGSLRAKVDNVTITINSNGELVAVGTSGGGTGGGGTGGSGGLSGIVTQYGTAGSVHGYSYSNSINANHYTDIQPPSGKLITDFMGGVVSPRRWRGMGTVDDSDNTYSYYELKSNFIRVYHYHTDIGRYYIEEVQYLFLWKDSSQSSGGGSGGGNVPSGFSNSIAQPFSKTIDINGYRIYPPAGKTMNDYLGGVTGAIRTAPGVDTFVNIPVYYNAYADSVMIFQYHYWDIDANTVNPLHVEGCILWKA